MVNLLYTGHCARFATGRSFIKRKRGDPAIVARSPQLNTSAQCSSIALTGNSASRRRDARVGVGGIGLEHHDGLLGLARHGERSLVGISRTSRNGSARGRLFVKIHSAVLAGKCIFLDKCPALRTDSLVMPDYVGFFSGITRLSPYRKIHAYSRPKCFGTSRASRARSACARGTPASG